MSLLAVPASAQFIPGIDLVETEDLGDGLYAFRFGPYRNIFIVTAFAVFDGRSERLLVMQTSDGFIFDHQSG